MTGSIEVQGFTNASLTWKSWLPLVDGAAATAEQLSVLKESHPRALESEYFLTLAHQPKILRHRSLAYNAIMYAPGGLSRSERELASVVVSRVNGCVYCASVHAQRYAQLAKESAIVAAVFSDPRTAGRTAREQAIIRFAIALTLLPAGPLDAQLSALREHLDDAEVLDLVHVVAIFAWANRLMLNLGEPDLAAVRT